MSRDEILLILSSQSVSWYHYEMNLSARTELHYISCIISLGLYVRHVPVRSVQSVLSVLRAHPVPPLHHPYHRSFLDVTDYTLLVVYQRDLLTLSVDLSDIHISVHETSCQWWFPEKFFSEMCGIRDLGNFNWFKYMIWTAMNLLFVWKN